MAKTEMEESQNIEFKRQYKDGIVSTVASFANTSGGELYLGIDDTKEVVGVNVTAELKDKIQQACNEIENPITVTTENKTLFDKEVLVIKVSKGKDIPYCVSGTVYVRTGAITRPATRQEIRDMMASSGYIQFEKQPVRNASYDDIDEQKVTYFLARRAQKRGVSIPEFPIRQILVNMDVAIKESGQIIPTTTGLLFFGRMPQKFIPHSRINIARFKGIVAVDFIDKAELIGSLPQLIEESEKFIRRNTRKASKIVDFERIDIPEYPYVAIREAIVNAVAHREYMTDKSPIQVYIFDDRIEIVNPGVPNVEIAELEGKHIPRNELICKLLSEYGYMEGFGTGIGRMRLQMREHGLGEPILEIKKQFFKVTFLGPKDDILKLIKPERTDLRKQGLNDRQIKALAYIFDNKVIAHKEYCEIFGVPNFTAYKELKELVDKGFIKQYGKGLDSQYYLQEES
jgi:ATP-dependent DNA helicase RecG